MFWQIFFELVFYYPLALTGFFVLAGTIYLLSLIFGGRGIFKQTVSTLGLSSFAIIFLFVPILSTLSLIWWTILLVIIFQKIQHYKMHSAVLTILIPFSILFALLYFAGLLNISFIATRISSLL